MSSAGCRLIRRKLLARANTTERITSARRAAKQNLTRTPPDMRSELDASLLATEKSPSSVAPRRNWALMATITVLAEISTAASRILEPHDRAPCGGGSCVRDHGRSGAHDHMSSHVRRARNGGRAFRQSPAAFVSYSDFVEGGRDHRCAPRGWGIPLECGRATRWSWIRLDSMTSRGSGPSSLTRLSCIQGTVDPHDDG